MHAGPSDPQELGPDELEKLGDDAFRLHVRGKRTARGTSRSRARAGWRPTGRASMAAWEWERESSSS